MKSCKNCRYDGLQGSSISMCDVCDEEYDEYLPKKEIYTKEQIERVIHNMSLILETTGPHIDNKDLELIFTCANDSMCRLEGILNYPKDGEKFNDLEE